ncbi:uncharacterized protein FIBRA_08749 [Fibroporia radiculosa]|uniref:Uncharacterized protein n=1 Tax=Fibroporia radiculosa TaxID=599839 RepID=J4GXC6_9APHY|nr:uncharacterized protein FIBRA_08749 [Fibroporia radiculosa]CCM06480.1 predicted protein [Fibroporia radiculosa]
MHPCLKARGTPPPSPSPNGFGCLTASGGSEDE